MKHRTFTFSLLLNNFQVTKFKPLRLYRNPVFLVREYKHKIDSGVVKSQAELARIVGLSRSSIKYIET